MTAGWLLANIVLVAVVAAIVAVPAVLIPNMLDRDSRPKVAQSHIHLARRPASARRWASEGERSADAA